MAEILHGIDVANAMKQNLIMKNTELIEKGLVPCLAIVRVDERGDDLAYENGVLKRFEELGLKVAVSAFPGTIAQDELEYEFAKINADKSVHGILLLRPLPKSLDEGPLKMMIDPEKDVDCMCPANIAKVFTGDDSGYAPCTPTAVMELLEHYGIPLAGKKVTLIGRSLVVGKPLAMLLIKENATVTVCHSKTENLPAECRNADIVVTAAGVAGLINNDHIRPGSIVIDVGVNVDESGNMRGDVDFGIVEKTVSKITPVPGGVGTVTTSVLAKHVLKAAEKTTARPV